MYVHLVGLVRENKLIKIHRIIHFKIDGRKHLGIPKCRRDDDIKINLKELIFFIFFSAFHTVVLMITIS
jgi:hypothetical protein